MIIQPGGPSLGFGTSMATVSPAREIPPLSDGSNPKFVYVCMLRNPSIGGGPVVGLIFGTSAVAAPTLLNTVGIPSWSKGLIFNVAGKTHYRAITPSSAVNFTMTPLSGIIPRG
jgi:hypothetical protein